MTRQPRRRLLRPRRLLGSRRLLALLFLCVNAVSHAATGSYATTGTGTYAQSLWWLDFSTYNDATASSGAGQALSYTLPNGAGTLTTTVKRSGGGTLAAVAEPAWTGGAFGHGAYDGITGNPIFYWINQTGTGTVQLASLTVKDAAGNARSFGIYAADGENTNSGETLTYTSTTAWKLIDTVNYYAGYNGAVPVTTGVGSGTVAESAPTSQDNSYNASIVLGATGPTQISAALNGNEGVLFGLSLPGVKWNLNVASRAAVADQFTIALGYTSPASSIKSVTTTGTNLSATTAAASVIGTNNVTLNVSMATGSPSPLSYYTGSVSCTNSGPGASSVGGAATVLPAGTGTSFSVTPQTGDSITCTLTLTPVTLGVSGTVYADANHNSNFDTGESGTGIAGLYVKLATSTNGVCQSPATSATAVAAGTGAYSIPNVSPGTYCLILSSNATLGGITAYTPSGWTGTEASGGARTLTTTASPSPVQNFGLYAGSQLNVHVFGDTGGGGGIGNDGTQNGGETGLANIQVTASVGSAALTSTSSDSTGLAVLWLPATVSGTVTVAPTIPAGDLATGGSAGTTAGSYGRPNVTFPFVSGNAYSGVTFGLVPGGSLASNGTLTTQPGTTVVYAHTFIAGSAGQVTFTTTALASPTLNGWTEVLYLDAACSGQLLAGDAVLNAPVSVVANQKVCILVKEYAPAGAPVQAQNLVTLRATLVFSGSAAPAAQQSSDVDTTLVTGGAVQFTKQVQNVTQANAYATSDTAAPGNTLQYQLTVVNQGSAPMNTVVINDATPSYTMFLSAACPATLPSGLSACSIRTMPTAGAGGPLQWTFSGVLQPGAQTVVTYQVLVAQ